MTLIQHTVKGVTVTAEQVTANFAIYPCILIDEDTETFYFSGTHWAIDHLPTATQLRAVYQEDPVEFPGEPRAVDLDKVREFAVWLETTGDWSRTENVGDITHDWPDATLRAWYSFAHAPNFWERPA